MGRSEEMTRKQDEMIRRSDAIKAINLIQNALFNSDILPVTPQTRERHDVIQGILRHVWKVKEKLEKLPAVQPEPPWIPCSKKLPERYENVLVTLEGGEDVLVACFGSICKQDCWFNEAGGCFKICDVIAWMPLPEPYVKDKKVD